MDTWTIVGVIGVAYVLTSAIGVMLLLCLRNQSSSSTRERTEGGGGWHSRQSTAAPRQKQSWTATLYQSSLRRLGREAAGDSPRRHHVGQRHLRAQASLPLMTDHSLTSSPSFSAHIDAEGRVFVSALPPPLLLPTPALVGGADSETDGDNAIDHRFCCGGPRNAVLHTATAATRKQALGSLLPPICDADLVLAEQTIAKKGRQPVSSSGGQDLMIKLATRMND